MTDETLTFDATVAKVQTLIDNGLRVTLDLPEQAIEAAAVLMALKRNGAALRVTVAISPCKSGQKQGNGDKLNKLDERPKRKSKRTTNEGPNTSRPTE